MKKIILFLAVIFTASFGFSQQFNCGDTLVDSGGLDTTYTNNEADTIYLCPTNPGEVIQLTFLSFDTEANYDFLTIYDSDQVGVNSLGTFDGLQNLGVFLAENPTGCLTVVFTSDGSVVNAGYSALIDCVPAPTCLRPSDFVASNTTNSSTVLSWTSNDTETRWVIEYGPTGFTPGTGTGTSIVSLTNPRTISGLDGTTTYDFYIRARCAVGDTSSYFGPLTVMTMTDPLVCGDTFTDSGSDTSAYQNGESLIYVACPTLPNEAIQVIFSEFQIENGWDFMTIYDANDTTSGTEIGTYTGSTSPGTIIAENTTGCLTFYFTSDGIISDTGWVASINCVPEVTCFRPTSLTLNSVTDLTSTISWTNGGSETQWIIEYGPAGFAQGTGTQVLTSSNPYTITGLTELTDYDVYVRSFCGGTDTSSYSSSLNFQTTMTPLPPFICGNLFTDEGGQNGVYSNSTMDTITICPTGGSNAVEVVFLSFETEQNYDSLMIYDGNSTSGTLIGSYQGTDTIGTVTGTTASGCLTFVFISDGSVVYDGWVAEINCVTNCIAPTSLNASSITATSASLSWLAVGGETSWMVEYGPAGFTPGTGTQVLASTNLFNLTGLNPLTSYNFYVAGICSPGDTSAYVNMGQFTTTDNASINENEIELISIYPNPSTGKFTIQNTSSEKVSYQLKDAQGRSIKLNIKDGQTNETTNIDLTRFENGVYFLEVSSNKVSKTYALVKN